MVLEDLIEIAEKEKATRKADLRPVLHGRGLHVFAGRRDQNCARQGRGRKRIWLTESKSAAWGAWDSAASGRW